MIEQVQYSKKADSWAMYIASPWECAPQQHRFGATTIKAVQRWNAMANAWSHDTGEGSEGIEPLDRFENDYQIIELVIGDTCAKINAWAVNHHCYYILCLAQRPSVCRSYKIL